MKKRMISLVGLVCFLLYILWGLKYERKMEEVASYKIDSMCLGTAEGSSLVSRVLMAMIGADNVYVEAESTLQNPGMQSFMDKAVVGEEFTPGPDLQARINSAEDFREDSYELRGNYAYKPAMLSAVSLTDATDNFTLYLLGRGVMVETPDSEYVYADICYISNYMVPPELKEMDFDEDGEAELAMITFVLHGTGMGIESLYMVDRDENGEWKMYYFLPSVYCETFREHFDTVSVEGGVRFTCVSGA